MANLSKYLLDKNSPLISRLQLKRDLLEKGRPDHQEIKTALVVGGGGMRGVFGAGVLLGLKTAGLSAVFDDVFAVSVGAPDCAYFLSGQPEFGTTIYFEELVTNKFINYLRIGQWMDINFLGEVFKNMKPLDEEKVRKSRSNFYVGVTDAQTGQGKFFNAKQVADLVDLLCATCTIPIAHHQPVVINGHSYYDGVIANGIPLASAVQAGSTDILLVLNSPIGKERSKLNNILASVLIRLYFKRFSPLFQKCLLVRDEIFEQSLNVVNNLPSTVNFGIIAPREMPIGRFSKDRKELREVTLDAEKKVVELFL